MYASFSPEHTPPVIRRLMIALGSISLLAALIDPLFPYFFNIPGPQYWLSLSPSVLQRGGVWTFLTHPFVLQPAGSLHFFFFLRLFFDLYIFWMLGGRLVENLGPKPVIHLLLASTLAAGGLGILGGGFFSGPSPALMAILVVWTMLNPDAQLLLFFTFPCLARWLLAGILGMLLLISLSNGDFGTFLWYLGGSGTAYFYALLAWELRSPFPVTHQFDHQLAQIGREWRQRRQEKRATDWQVYHSHSKIVDFRSGKAVLKDDEFMDAMLEKISLKGEKSLSFRERWRMHRISKRKKQNG